MTAHVEDLLPARIVAAPHAALEVVVTLRYERADPFAVSVVFPAQSTLEGTDIVWVFARELLETGLRAAEGDGDVRLRPSGRDRTVIELHAPEATALVEFTTASLRRFLWHSYRLTPRGEEHLELDLDGELSELLGGVQ